MDINKRGEVEDHFQDLRDDGRWAPSMPGQIGQQDQIDNQPGTDQFKAPGGSSNGSGNAGSQIPVQP